MPKKKISPKKVTVANKTTKAAKSAKLKKSIITNYLAPLHKITACIKKDYQALDKLLESTPAKLKKAIAETQFKLNKSKETQVKTEKLLVQTKNQKIKPTDQHKQTITKH